MNIRIISSDIYWVFWREIKKFIQQKPRIVMAIVQPAIWLVLMGNAMSGLTANPMAIKMLGTNSYLSFMMPGVMIMTALFGGVFGGTTIVWDRRLGILNKMLSAPIHRSAIPLGKLIAIGVQSMFQATIIVIIGLCIGVHISSGISGFIGMLIISSIFGIIMGGISLSIAAVIKSMESLMAIVNFLTMPLMFTSNAMFPTSSMPVWLQWMAKFNPLTYAVGTMRSIAAHGFIWTDLYKGIIVLLVAATITIVITIKMFNRSIS
jgi:ABC-2 type transport system permease protein